VSELIEHMAAEGKDHPAHPRPEAPRRRTLPR